MQLNPQTIRRFRDRLVAQNMPITQWARDRNFNPYSIYRLINGYECGLRGKSHIVANAIQQYADDTDTSSHHATAVNL